MSGLRLEWRHHPSQEYGECWIADGHLLVPMVEHGGGGGFEWTAHDQKGVADTLIAAQLAAEATCRDLAVESLTPFAETPRDLIVDITLVGETSLDRFNAAQFASEHPGDAESLALALLASSRASRRDSTP